MYLRTRTRTYAFRHTPSGVLMSGGRARGTRKTKIIAGDDIHQHTMHLLLDPVCKCARPLPLRSM